MTEHEWMNDPSNLVARPVSRFWRIFAILAVVAIVGGVLFGLAS